MRHFAHYLPILYRTWIKNIATRVVVVLLLLFIIILGGCSRTKSDAKSAAKFTNKSVELAIELRLEESEKTYFKAQKIIKKYRKTKKEEVFFQHYQAYRDEAKKILRQK